MNVNKIIDRLRMAIGLDPDSIGSRAVEACIHRRLLDVGVHDEAAYLARLDADPEELGRLIDATVVTETWFFRNGPAFDALRAWVAPAAASGRTLRILSLPCATGEEPYSLAIALLEAGLPAEQFEIDAVDVSEYALGLAERARYGPNSFRFGTDPVASPWFERDGERWSPVPIVRRCVRFLQGNILDAAFMQSLSPYDIVACRNLYIYLEPGPLELAKAMVNRLIRMDGALLLGHADWTPELLAQFETVGPAAGFMYRPRTEADIAVRPKATATERRSRKPTPRPVREQAPCDAGLADPLATARQLANRGLLDEAEAECRAILASGGPDPDALFLLALTAIARGEPERAIEPLRRAVALNPEHEEAQIHLALVVPSTKPKRRAS